MVLRELPELPVDEQRGERAAAAGGPAAAPALRREQRIRRGERELLQQHQEVPAVGVLHAGGAPRAHRALPDDQGQPGGEGVPLVGAEEQARLGDVPRVRADHRQLHANDHGGGRRVADGGGAAVLQPESVPRVHREERPDRDREAEAAARGECEAEKTITSFGVFVGTRAFEVG